MICYVSIDTCTSVIVPLVQKFCEEIPKQCSDSLLTAARLFGKLSHGLSSKDKIFQETLEGFMKIVAVCFDFDS